MLLDLSKWHKTNRYAGQLNQKVAQIKPKSLAQNEPISILNPGKSGTIWTEMPGTNRPKWVAQFDPSYPLERTTFLVIICA